MVGVVMVVATLGDKLIKDLEIFDFFYGGDLKMPELVHTCQNGHKQT